MFILLDISSMRAGICGGGLILSPTVGSQEALNKYGEYSVSIIHVGGGN